MLKKLLIVFGLCSLNFHKLSIKLVNWFHVLNSLKKMNRGLKSNNPANIRLSSSHWKGQINGADREFCKFSTLIYGVRALICLIRTYRFKYGLSTVRQIISRFAPPSENDTSTYITNVCNRLHCSPDDCLYLDWYDYSNFSVLYRLCLSICIQETGFNLTHEMFLDALLLSDPLIASDYYSFKSHLNNVLQTSTY